MIRHMIAEKDMKFTLSKHSNYKRKSVLLNRVRIYSNNLSAICLIIVWECLTILWSWRLVFTKRSYTLKSTFTWFSQLSPSVCLKLYAGHQALKGKFFLFILSNTYSPKSKLCTKILQPGNKEYMWCVRDLVPFVQFNKAKVTLLHGCFSHFLNCTNGTKSRNASHI